MATPPTSSLEPLTASARRLTRTMVAAAHTRLELVTVELQEERDRWLAGLLLALGCAAFGLLAGIALTALIILLLWEFSPALSALALTMGYGTTALLLYARLRRHFAATPLLGSTVEQLRKDRDALEQWLS